MISICISWALLFYTHVSLCVRIRGLCRMYHRYHMASSRLYYKLKNECPVRRSGRAIVALTGKGGTMVDKALDEKRTHNNSDGKKRKRNNDEEGEDRRNYYCTSEFETRRQSKSTGGVGYGIGWIK